MFHYAKYRNDELIVLGYNPPNNDCYVVRLVGLPGDEQEELRRIASSTTAQEEPYLVNIISRPGMEKVGTGETWWSYLLKQSARRHSPPVFKIRLSDIQESLDPDQRAIFKGYGKGRLENRKSAQDQPIVSDTPDKLDLVLGAMAEQQKMMLELMKALAPSKPLGSGVKKKAESKPTKVLSTPKSPMGAKPKKTPPLVTKEELDSVVVSD